VGVIDPVDHPPRGGVAGHLPEQFVLIPQSRQVRQSISTIGDHHRQIR
jgi:hypothetical protein